MQAPTEQIEKIAESLIKACSDLNSMTRDAMNATLQSASALTKGCEEMCDSVSALVQKSLENGAQAGRAMLSAKTVHDLVDVHTGLMKSSFDNLLIEMNKLSQLSSRIAQQASEPVTQQMNAAITKISSSKAA